MPKVLRRLNLSPRALALAGAAILVFLVWRRGGGGGEGGIEGPLTSIPPGTDELPEPSGIGTMYPFPTTGGILHIPGEDPIVLEPLPVPPPPTTPPTPTPTLRYFGRTWRKSQLAGFRAEWARRRRRSRQSTSAAAWQTFLRQHPAIARFFGLPVPGASASTTAAAVPQPRVDPVQAEAVASSARALDTPAAAAAVPRQLPRPPVSPPDEPPEWWDPRWGPWQPGQTPPIMADPGSSRRPRRRRKPHPPKPPKLPARRMRTISGADVIMPARALRGPRSPRRKITGGAR